MANDMSRPKDTNAGFRRGFLLPKPKRDARTNSKIPIPHSTDSSDLWKHREATSSTKGNHPHVAVSDACGDSNKLILEPVASRTSQRNKSSSSSSSCALLDLEHGGTSVSTLKRNPLVVVVDDDDDDEDDKTADVPHDYSEANTAPLIVPVGPTASSDNKDGCLFVEVSSVRRCARAATASLGQIAECSYPQQPHEHESPSSSRSNIIRNVPTSLQVDDGRRAAVDIQQKVSVEDRELDILEVVSSSPRAGGLLEATAVEGCNDTLRAAIQQELASVIYRLRRTKKSNWRSMTRSFLKSEKLATVTARRVVWETLLDSVVGLQKSARSVEFWLALFMLKHGDDIDDAFLSFFRSTVNDKTSRSRQLGAIHLLDIWSSDDDTIELACALSLVNQVFPLLVDTIASSSTSKKPTVLEHQILDVAYRLINVAANRVFEAPPETDISATLAASLWTHAELLTQLWDVQLKWLECEGLDWKGQTLDWGDLPLEEVRRRCKVAVLADWQQVYEECRKRCDNTNEGRPTVARLWCECLSTGQTGAQSGSVAQTLATSIDPISKETILTAFTSAEADSRISCKGSVSPSPLVLDDRRIIVRGLVAWIGQRRKHLGSLGRDEILQVSWWLLEALVHRGQWDEVAVVAL
jgi:hypothetical protein